MAMKTDMLGFQYDDAHPSFVYFVRGNPLNEDGAEKFVYHRPSKRILDEAALQAQATEAGYSFPPGEVGQDDEWLWANTGIGPAPVPDQDPTDAYGAYPGEFNGNAPADMAALTAADITPTPATAWTAGEYVVLGDGSEAYWDGEAWVAGRAKPVITNPEDGQTVYSAYYPIIGRGAKPGFEVQLFSIDHPYANGKPQDTVKARPDGSFIFAGTQPASPNDAWKVVSVGQESEQVRVVTAEPAPIAFTATPDDLTVTVTITSAVQGNSTIDFGEGTPATAAANDPKPYTYAEAGTYSVTVTPPTGAQGVMWEPASKDVTVTAPAPEEPEEPEEPEPDPAPDAGDATVDGGAQ